MLLLRLQAVDTVRSFAYMRLGVAGIRRNRERAGKERRQINEPHKAHLTSWFPSKILDRFFNNTINNRERDENLAKFRKIVPRDGGGRGFVSGKSSPDRPLVSCDFTETRIHVPIVRRFRNCISLSIRERRERS